MELTVLGCSGSYGGPRGAACSGYLVRDGDTAIWLKYYADDKDRLRWHHDFPDDPIPAHEPLPFDRDRHLPGRSLF